MFGNGIARRSSTQLWAWHSRTGAQTPLGLQPWLTPLLLLQALLLCLLLHHPLHWTTLRSWKKEKQNTPWLKIHLLHSSHRSFLLHFWCDFDKKIKEKKAQWYRFRLQQKEAIIYWTSKKNLGKKKIYIYIYTPTHTYTWRVEERLQRGVVAGTTRLSAIANPQVQNSNSEFLIQQQQ